MASVAKRKWTHKGVAAEAWVVRYMDENAVRRSKQFETKKQAEGFKRKVERELEDGCHIPRSETMTVADLCDDYLRAQDKLHADGVIADWTLRSRRCLVTAYIKPHLGRVLLTDLSRDRIDRFIGDLRTSGRRKGGQNPGLGGGTVKHIVLTLCWVVDFGERRRVVAVNHVRAVNRWPEHRSGGTVPIRTFTPTEIQTLLLTLEDRRHRQQGRTSVMTRAMVYLAAFCGLRLGEVLGLTWECVDLDAGMLDIRHNLDASDTLRGPKTRAGYRTVPMPRVVADTLREWLPLAPADPRGLLFRSRTGAQLSPTAIHTKYWRPALLAAGLGPDAAGRRFHFHALRHFAASMMVERIPLADTAQLLGHKSFDITLQVYAHPVATQDHKRAALEGVSQRMAPPRLTDATAPQHDLTH